VPNKMSAQTYRITRESGGSSWCRGVEHILRKYGFALYWDSENIGSKSDFMSEFKDESKLEAMLSLYEQCVDSTTASLFRVLAFEIPFGEGSWYLTHLGAKNAMELIKFRLRNCYVGEETRGWQGSPRGGEVCSVCGRSDTDLHYVLECFQFQSLKIKYIHVYFRTGPTQDKLIRLLLSKDIPTLNNISLYLRKANQQNREWCYDLKRVHDMNIMDLSNSILDN